MIQPHWNVTEWNCLAGLKGPLALHARDLVDAEIAAAQAELKSLRGDVPRGDDLRAKIEAAVIAASRQRAVGHERKALLRDLVEEFRGEYRKPETCRSHESLARRVRDLFAEFAVDDFRTTFEDVYGAEIVDEEPYKRIQACEKRIEAASKKREGMLKTTERFFRTTPARFREGTAGPEAMRLLILRTFVDEWRKRAALFDQPVTILGTSIATLPVEGRDEWAAAYKALGLAPTERPVYRAIDGGDRTRTSVPPPPTVAKTFAKN